MSTTTRTHWLSGFLSGPGIAFALVPACPACWPAYAGVLGALGLGTMVDVRLQLPLTLLFLGIALAALLFRARARRGYGPALLGALSAAIILAGKFALLSVPVTTAGAAALIAAAIWNVWPRRATAPGACSACTPVESVRAP